MTKSYAFSHQVFTCQRLNIYASGSSAQRFIKEGLMKEGIHPKLSEVKVACACGNVISTVSTREKDFSIDICAKCHPFFTGQQRLIDSAGRVEKFNKKYAHLKKKDAKKDNS